VPAFGTCVRYAAPRPKSAPVTADEWVVVDRVRRELITAAARRAAALPPRTIRDETKKARPPELAAPAASGVSLRVKTARDWPPSYKKRAVMSTVDRAHTGPVDFINRAAGGPAVQLHLVRQRPGSVLATGPPAAQSRNQAGW
jgi:hypothetical protein